MRKIINKVSAVILASTIIIGCIKPYAPSIITGNNNYLVVEGLINTGQDSTFFKLSRTVKLSGTTAPKPELNAIITIESDQQNSYTLQEAGNGIYSSSPLNLLATAKYRLRIKTSDSKEYLSDFVGVKGTPDIDSISYQQQNNGVQLYVNTHDPQNNTRYYRWDFSETWKYISFYNSFYKLGPDGYPAFRLAYRDSDDIYNCYKTGTSQQILLSSSAKLAQDVIAMQPLNFVAAGTGKISHGYNYVLRQYALTPDGFTYWQNLKKNTEQLGSIFDAQPSTLQGNIHCVTNPAEPVLGYISASSVKSDVIFIDPIKLNLFLPYYLGPPEADECILDAIFIAPASSFHNRLNNTFGRGDSVLINSISPPGVPIIVGYSYAPKECVDCRAKAPFGTNTIPGYWPYQ